MQAVIEHLCANPVHQVPVDVENPVIQHAGRSAYCPLGREADGHDWRATGGKTLATVREWLGRPASAVHDDEALLATSGR